MSERSVALQSKAYLELKEAYTNRFKAALEFKANGGRVIGVWGTDVPEEIIIAAGLFPLRVCTDVSKPSVLAQKYISKVNNLVGSQIDRLIDGTYADICQNIAISNSCGVIASIYEVIHNISRVFPDLRTPPMTYIDVAKTKYSYNQDRNVILYGEFRKTVEAWIGRQIRESELKDAIDLCNADRQALREFDALRWGEESRVTGTEALTVIGASLFMDRKRHLELVKELIEEAKNWPVIDAPRILVYGSDHEYLDLYNILEAAGGQPIFEDQNWGARHYDMDVQTDVLPIRGLAGRYMNRMFAANNSYVHERVDQMKEFIEKYKVDGVLFYMNMNDETYSWDYPEQKKVLDAMGIPSQVYYNQPFPIADPEGLQAQLAELVKAAKGDK